MFIINWQEVTPSSERCFIIGRDGEYWLAPNYGFTTDLNSAHVYRCREALELIRAAWNNEGIRVGFPEDGDVGYGPNFDDPLIADPNAPPPPTVAPVVTVPADSAPSPETPIRLTRQQCQDNIDELVRKQTYIHYYDGSYVKEPFGSGHTRDPESRFRTTVTQAMERNLENRFTYELVDQELAKTILSRKCSAAHILGRGICEMLKLAPLNLTARAKVMAVVGQMPPDSLDTWEKIKDWVEATFQPKTAARSSPAVASTLDVRISFNDIEHGTVNYSHSRQRSETYRISTEAILNIIRVFRVSNVDDLRIRVQSHIDENAWGDLEPELDDQGEISYDNYESSSHTDERVVLRDGPTGLQNSLVLFARSHLPPEIQRQLGLVPAEPPPPPEPPF